jgi:hypothetical protein
LAAQEAICAAPGEDQQRFEEALRLACAYVQGDPSVAEASRLLRLPGSHNRKNPEAVVRVEIIRETSRQYELGDLVDFWSEAQPILPEPARPKKNGSAGEAWTPNDGPVDVDVRLATMTYGASDGTGVNATYCATMPKMLRDIPWDAAIERFVDASMAAGTRAGEVWSRAQEIKDTTTRALSTIQNALLKNYNISDGIPDCVHGSDCMLWQQILDEGLRPEVGRNRYGLFIRRPWGSNSKEGSGKEDTDKEGADGTTAGNAGAEKKFRFRLVSFQDMRPGLEPKYLVDELIPSAGLTLIWGKQKTFKSFWLLDLMLHVAMGWTYRDMAVRQGTIVYCAFEGAHGYKGRIEALRRHYHIADDVPVPLFVMPGQADLIKLHGEIITDFRAQLGDAKPAVVVLDTLNRSLRGSENTEDMARYTEAAEAIRAAFDCVVIIVHHCGYDDTHSRGHTSLPAAVDAELEVARGEGSPLLVVTVKHMREGPEGMAVRCRAQSIPLDPDQNGKARNSIVIVSDDSATAPTSTRTGRPDNATPAMLDAVRAALGTHGIQFHPDNKMPLQAVEQDEVRKVFYRQYVDAESDKKKSDSARAHAFSRALKKLIADGLVRGQNTDQEKTMLWLASAEENYR